ncbi:hypothetical protein Tco_0496468 [Tanacetum coccineum]
MSEAATWQKWDPPDMSLLTCQVPRVMVLGKKNCNYKEFMPSSSPRPLTPSSSFPKPSTPPSSSHGPSRYASSLGNVECSNCKLLALKTKILDARLDMERHSDNHMSISWNTS